jgi:hypothetical protein
MHSNLYICRKRSNTGAYGSGRSAEGEWDLGVGVGVGGGGWNLRSQNFPVKKCTELKSLAYICDKVLFVYFNSLKKCQKT